VGGNVVADSRHAPTLRESAYPPVQYVPMPDADQGVLHKTGTSAYCMSLLPDRPQQSQMPRQLSKEDGSIAPEVIRDHRTIRDHERTFVAAAKAA
jgi:hypothetical protein